jgi:hypothetical protein
MPHTAGSLYDQRLDKDEARALMARRIDAYTPRYRKETFGLPANAKLADHAEVRPVVGATTSMADRPYRTLQWGVFVNGQFAGYITQKLRWRGPIGEQTSYISSKLSPWGNPAHYEVYDPAVHGEPVQR